jgi:hypothetical protein
VGSLVIVSVKLRSIILLFDEFDDIDDDLEEYDIKLLSILSNTNVFCFEISSDCCCLAVVDGFIC